ncbi:snake venom 5'-nucleotidase-like [Physella acuta]|uniref:snake venom 5'-nucleotidase-like n=1 Tax=Physella acuta TaxID=109671 RepID=UPI0027DE1C4D|nr:snake venom 5'-nucleotidase-like [Physella acuta]XP_059173796.1 snake venom 5'-nucleotidase-like [Physella acuta]
MLPHPCRGLRLYHILCLCAAVLCGVRADFSLTILHTNDVHSRIEETDKNSAPCSQVLQNEGKCFGGAARIRTMVKRKRAEHNNTILLDAGDQFQGTLWFYQFGGIVSAQFMNLIGYNAMAVGNHEFDKGVMGLAPFAMNLTFPLLSSNMILDKTPELQKFIKKSAVVIVGGQRIGVVGYTTLETAYISNPGTVKFSDELVAVQREIDALVAIGVNKIIALGHSGYAIDLDLAHRLTDVDIIVGGHTNTFLYNGTSPSTEKIEGMYPTVVESISGGRVLVIQDYAYGKYLGELNVVFDDAGRVKSWTGNPILLDNSVPKDNETAALVDSYLPQIDQIKKNVVGQTYVSLLADRIVCRTTECNLGNLVTDAIVYHNLRKTNTSWSDAGMAVVNAGSFRASINIGNITTENVIFVQPFRNEVDIIEILGQTLVDMFEFCAEKWTKRADDAFGGFLQVSGIQVTYDLSRPVGQRVHEVLVVCTECTIPKLEPLEVNKKYKLLTSSYIINGGDGYSMLPGKILNRIPIGDLDTDIFLDYVQKFSPITIGLQGRIRHLADVIDETYCPSSHNGVSVPMYSLSLTVTAFLTSLLYSMLVC